MTVLISVQIFLDRDFPATYSLKGWLGWRYNHHLVVRKWSQFGAFMIRELYGQIKNRDFVWILCVLRWFCMEFVSHNLLYRPSLYCL